MGDHEGPQTPVPQAHPNAQNPQNPPADQYPQNPLKTRIHRILHLLKIPSCQMPLKHPRYHICYHQIAPILSPNTQVNQTKMQKHAYLG